MKYKAGNYELNRNTNALKWLIGFADIEKYLMGIHVNKAEALGPRWLCLHKTNVSFI